MIQKYITCSEVACFGVLFICNIAKSEDSNSRKDFTEIQIWVAKPESPLGPSVTCAQCALAQLSGCLGADSELEVGQNKLITIEVTGDRRQKEKNKMKELETNS